MARCLFGFHDWSPWIRGQEHVMYMFFNPKGLITTRNYQTRYCLRPKCRKTQREEIY